MEASLGALEQFVSSNPNSPWAPSLRANLGRYYEQRGVYSQASEHWAAAWKAVKSAKSGPEKQVADFVLAHWAEDAGGLGQMDSANPTVQERAIGHVKTGIFSKSLATPGCNSKGCCTSPMSHSVAAPMQSITLFAL